MKQELPDFEKEIAKTHESIRKGNSEIVLARIQKQIADVELELSRKATLPTLGFNTTYANVAPAEGWDRASAETMKPNDRTFTVGLELHYTLYNDGQKDAVRQAAVARQKAEYFSEQTEQTALKNLSSLSKKLGIGQKRLRIAQLSREMAEKNLQTEYEKIKVGESSVRTVIEAQSGLNTARIAELGSRIDLYTGLGELRTMGGRLPSGLAMDYKATKIGSKQ